MSDNQPRRGGPRDWAELVRIPNTPTVIADVAAGAVLVAGGSEVLGPAASVIAGVVCSVLAAVALYWAGMIYNDLADLADDRAAGRSRPLVEQRIPIRSARSTLVGLFGFGLVAAVVAGSVASERQQWAPVLGIAATLAALIYLYDGPLKRLPFAPVLMGGCRVCSFLLGGVTVLVASSPQSTLLGQSIVGLPAVLWGFALSMGVYITGLTTFARREAGGQRTVHLTIGLLVMIAGVVGLAFSPWLADGVPRWRIDTRFVFPAAMVLVTGGTLLKAIAAIRRPSAGSIGQTIGSGITSIIPVAAVIAMLAGGPVPAIAIAALMLPVFGLRRRFAQT